MRLTITVMMMIFLSACGFTPVYRTKPPLQTLSSIEIAIIANREGQIVRNHLIDRLYRNGYPSNPRYRLVVSSIAENIVEIGIDKDDEASRAQLRLSAELQLYDTAEDKRILIRNVRATTGYNILAGQFTTFVTEEDARKQGLRAISDNIITQLELHFK